MSNSVTITEAGHETVGWSQCARDLVSEFIENLQVTDTSCASTPETVWPAVGRFPLLAKDARPAEVDSIGANQIGLAERKVVTVAKVGSSERRILRSTTQAGLMATTTSSRPHGHLGFWRCAP
jgi:hypothetical protein